MTKNTLLKSRMGLTPPNWLLCSLLLFIVNTSVVKGQQTIGTAVLLKVNDECEVNTQQYIGFQEAWFTFTAVTSSTDIEVADHIATSYPAPVFDSVFLYDDHLNQLAVFTESSTNWTEILQTPDTGNIYYIRMKVITRIEHCDFDICLKSEKACVPNAGFILSTNTICLGDTLFYMDDSWICQSSYELTFSDSVELLSCDFSSFDVNNAFSNILCSSCSSGGDATGQTYLPPCWSYIVPQNTGWNYIELCLYFINNQGQYQTDCHLDSFYVADSLHQTLAIAYANINDSTLVPFCYTQYDSTQYCQMPCNADSLFIYDHSDSTIYQIDYIFSDDSIFSAPPPYSELAYITISPGDSIIFPINMLFNFEFTCTDTLFMRQIYYHACDTDTTYMNIIFGPPQIDFTAEEACLGDTTFFYPYIFCGDTLCFDSICNGNFAGDSILLTWDFGDGTGIVNDINPWHIYDSAGSYDVTLTATVNGFFCTFDTTKTITVTTIPKPLISGPIYACSSDSGYILLNFDSRLFYSYSIDTLNPFQFWWNPINPLYIPWGNTGGVLYVYAMNDKGCMSYDSLVVFDCCEGPIPQYNFHNTTFSNAPLTYNNVDLYFSGTIVFQGTGVPIDYTFNGCNMYFATNTKVIINKGAYVKIDENSHLQSCDDKMWEGIYIDEGELEVTGNSIIQDAKNAVVSIYGSKYNIHNATLDRNYHHLVVRHFPSQHPGEIYDTELSCSAALLPQYPYIPNASQTRFAIAAYRVNGVQFGNPQNLQYKNKIKNCDVGIYCLSSAAEVYNNDFQSIYAPINLPISEKKGFGIFVEKQLQIGTPVSSIIVGGVGNLPGVGNFRRNTFTNVTNGVYTYQYQNIRVDNNIFDMTTASSVASKAIQVDEYVHYSGNKYITQNTINNYRTGITLNNVENITVSNNDISNFFVSPYGGLSYGIRVLGGSYVKLLSNDIENSMLSTRTEGISISTAPSSTVHCNRIENMGKSIHLQGTMLPFSLRQNRMEDGVDALVFSYATIGTQGSANNPQGNTWYGNFSNSQTIMINSWGSNSKFYCKQGLHTIPTVNMYQGFGDLYYPYYTNSNSWPSCAQVVPATTSLTSLYNVANDQISFGLYEQENKWMARKQVLLKMKRDSIFGDPLLTQFALSQQNTGTALAQTVEDTLAINIYEAQLLNSTINAQLYNEVARKTINVAFFAKESDSLLAPTQFEIGVLLLDSLKWIAQQCPFEFGEAVYQARMFLAMTDTTEYVNECEFEPTGTPDKSAISPPDDTSNIAVWPNPFGDEINIVFSNPSETVCYATILDLTGKTIFTFEIPEKTDTYRIPAERMANGVYYLKIWNTCQILKYSKIVKY